MTSVQLHRLSTTRPEQEAADFLASFLASTLPQRPSLVLLSGGSAIPLYQQAFTLLAQKGLNFPSLVVSLVDERWVPVGHADSNEQQLRAAGVLERIKKLGGSWLSYLRLRKGLAEGSAVAKAVGAELGKYLDSHQLIILAGMGDDAHTAGLLPTHNADVVKNVFQTPQLVAYYQLPTEVENPHRQRITTTPALLSQAERIVLYALGDQKRAALQRLVDGSESLPDCPVMVLRSAQFPVVVLTDQNL